MYTYWVASYTVTLCLLYWKPSEAIEERGRDVQPTQHSSEPGVKDKKGAHPSTLTA